MGQLLRFLFMHTEDFTVGGSLDCAQTSNIYEIHYIYIEKHAVRDWKKGEQRKSINYYIIYKTTAHPHISLILFLQTIQHVTVDTLQ